MLGTFDVTDAQLSDVKSPEQRVPSRHKRNSVIDESEGICSGLLTSRGRRVSDVKSPEHRVLRLPIRILLLTSPRSPVRDF